MDVFTKYMDEFANLAGDFTRAAPGASGDGTESSSAEQPPQPEPKDFPQPSMEEIIKNPYNLSKDEMYKLLHACMYMRESTECPVNAFNQAMQAQMAAEAEKKASDNDTTTAAGPSASGNGKSELNTEKPEAKPSTSSNSSVESDDNVTRDGTPDKADDWTMINKVKGKEYSVIYYCKTNKELVTIILLIELSNLKESRCSKYVVYLITHLDILVIRYGGPD